jgi:hypothetical protein
MTREKRVGTRIVGHDCGASPQIKREQIKAKNGLARDASIGLYRVTSDTVSTGRYGATNCWTSHSCKCPLIAFHHLHDWQERLRRLGQPHFLR